MDPQKKTFGADTLAVGKILEGSYFFHVPSYQRPFSWEEDQFSDLITDLVTAPRQKDYFLGTIVLHRVENQDHYDIVDGQQRLTSLLILLACLRDRIESISHKDELHRKILQQKSVLDGIPEKVRLEVKDHAIFAKHVVAENGTLTEVDTNNAPEPQIRYFTAIRTFAAAIHTLTEDDKEALAEFISQRCFVIFLSTKTFEDAFRLFTIVNDRGKQLRRIDILKSLNISPSLVTKSSLREKLAKDWEAYENSVGEDIFESVVHLWRFIILKDKPQGDLVTEFTDRIFDQPLTPPVPKGEKFVLALFDLMELYESIFISKDVIPATDKNRNKFRSLIHIMHCEFKASEWRACILAFAKRFKTDKLYEFTLAIEKKYLELWAKATRKDERFGVYSHILTAISKASSAEEACKSITYDKAPILTMVGNKNLYGAGYCKYILLRLELLCSEFDVDKFIDAKSIEHVMPQKPAAGSKWLNIHNVKDMPSYVNSVGNLVLLSKSKNSSVSNLDFDEKKTKYLKARVSDYPRSIQVLDESDWSEETIKKRTNHAIKTFLEPL